MTMENRIATVMLTLNQMAPRDTIANECRKIINELYDEVQHAKLALEQVDADNARLRGALEAKE